MIDNEYDDGPLHDDCPYCGTQYENEEDEWVGSSPEWAEDPEDWKPELEKKDDE